LRFSREKCVGGVMKSQADCVNGSTGRGRSLFATAALAWLLLTLTSSIARAQSIQFLNYPAIHEPVVGEKGMVASQNYIATRVGTAILRTGGNAVDAAVATALALAVVLPRAGNLGGGGFMLVHFAHGNRNFVIDYQCVAPSEAELSMYVDPQGRALSVAELGYRAAAVPGTVAGLYLAETRYGRLSWRDVVRPALELARNGFILSHEGAHELQWAHQRLAITAEGRREFFRKDGTDHQPGDLFRQPDLAWTLRRIQRSGAQAFYRGSVARKIVADMKAHGGLISLADLAAYKPVIRAPLMGEYRGLTVYTPPPASMGGTILLEMLNTLSNFDLAANGMESAASLHLVAEAMKLAMADRYRYMGDTAFVQVPLAALTSKAYGEARARLISPSRTLAPSAVQPGDLVPYEGPDTTQISVVDADGNAVSNTFTIDNDFGTGIAVAGAGFLLNNGMTLFSNRAAAQARTNGTALPPNAMAPGKRMMSSMTPTMVFKGGKLWLVTGSPGGSTIPATVLQVILNVIDYNLNIEQATAEPRIFQGATGPLEIEPDLDPDTRAILQRLGHNLKVVDAMGAAQSIVVQGGHLYGGSDPRRPGSLAASADGVP
jgi:gamma-glutamyltranspeptidase / glutathione hydrolase